MDRRQIEFSFASNSLVAHDYSIIVQDKISRTVFANGNIKTTVAGTSMTTITVKGIIPSGGISQFVSCFASLVGKQSQLLRLDGHTMAATLDRYELRPSEEAGLIQFVLIMH